MRAITNKQRVRMIFRRNGNSVGIFCGNLVKHRTRYLMAVQKHNDYINAAIIENSDKVVKLK